MIIIIIIIIIFSKIYLLCLNTVNRQRKCDKRINGQTGGRMVISSVARPALHSLLFNRAGKQRVQCHTAHNPLLKLKLLDCMYWNKLHTLKLC